MSSIKRINLKYSPVLDLDYGYGERGFGTYLYFQKTKIANFIPDNMKSNALKK